MYLKIQGPKFFFISFSGSCSGMTHPRLTSFLLDIHQICWLKEQQTNQLHIQLWSDAEWQGSSVTFSLVYLWISGKNIVLINMFSFQIQIMCYVCFWISNAFLSLSILTRDMLRNCVTQNYCWWIADGYLQ